MTAVTHGLKDMAETLKPSVEDCLPNIKFNFESKALIPPKPVFPQNSPVRKFYYNSNKSDLKLAPSPNLRGRHFNSSKSLRRSLIARVII